MKILFYCSTILLFAGCEALNNYDRSATVYADVNTQKVGVKYTIWGAKQPGKGTLTGNFQIEGSLADGKQVLSIER